MKEKAIPHNEDATSNKTLSKPGKGKIGDGGKANGLFKSYISSATLKSSYYHIIIVYVGSML